MMAFSINRVTLLGRCSQDPELRYTADGTPVCNVNVATSFSYKKGDEWEEVPQFTRCVFWRNQAEYVARNVAKGEFIYIEGRLQTRKWEDKDGQARYTTEVIADGYVIPKGKGDVSSRGEDNGTAALSSTTGEELEDVDTENMPF